MKFTKWHFFVAAVIVAVIAATWQYVASPNAISASAALPTAFIPLPAGADSLCRVTDTTMVRERGLDANSVAFARANGYYNWCIPEFDDDQRLFDGRPNSEDYGAIAHVMAAPELDGLRLTNQFDGQYLRVAIVAVESPVSSDLAPYHDLGLTAQNCLYLQHYSKFFDAWHGWTALMVPPDKNLVCPASPQASATKTVLAVTVEPPYSNNYADYPPTTRFIEGAGGRTLIGVKCATAWCIVGPPGFGDVPASAHAHATAAIPAKAQSIVKGWFDDQVLGVADGSGELGIHRRFRASAIPDAGLGSLKVADFMVTNVGTETYKVVGRTFFPDSLPTDSKYAKVYGFSRGLNVVALRAEFHPATSTSPKADTAWFAQVTDANGNVRNDIPTRRTDHRKIDPAGNLVLASIPATMRWRWFDSDEDLWVECDLGCCLVGVKDQ